MLHLPTCTFIHIKTHTMDQDLHVRDTIYFYSTEIVWSPLIFYSLSLCIPIHFLTKVFFRPVWYPNIQDIFMLEWRSVGSFYCLFFIFFFWFFPLPFLITLCMWTFLFSVICRFMNFKCTVEMIMVEIGCKTSSSHKSRPQIRWWLHMEVWLCVEISYHFGL